MTEKLETLVAHLDLTRVLRYSSAGGLFVAFSAVLAPEWTKARIDALGAVLGLLTVFVIGAPLYLFHRHFLGELFLYPYFRFVHWCWDQVKARFKFAPNSPYGFIAEFKVPFAFRRAAYVAVRRSLDESTIERFNVARSELHILVMAATFPLGAAAVGAFFLGSDAWRALVPIGVVAMVVSTCAEIVQNGIETRVMQSQRAHIRQKLAELDFVLKENPTAGAEDT